MNYKISLLLPFFLLSLAACDLNGTPNDQKREKTAATQYKQNTPLQYSTVSLQRASHTDCLANNENASINCATIAVHYPKIEKGTAEAISEQINSQIYAHVSHALNDYVESGQDQGKRSKVVRLEDKLEAYLREFNVMLKEQPEMPGWERQLNGKVEYDQNGILAVSFDQYGYEGGAHPNSLVSFLNFDLNTSVNLSLNDVFKANYEAELSQIAETFFRQERNVPQGDALDQAGFWFENNRFVLNDNFSFRAEGLVFLFNAYEIAPYVMGPTEFIIPWQNIAHLINPQGPLAWAAIK